MNKTSSPEQARRLARLDAMTDDQIDLSDIPETSPALLMQAVRRSHYRPVKTPVTIRLDSDVVAWFKDHAEGGRYQSEINRVLRQHVTQAEKRRPA